LIKPAVLSRRPRLYETTFSKFLLLIRLELAAGGPADT
jgi:hypothetical protein